MEIALKYDTELGRGQITSRRDLGSHMKPVCLTCLLLSLHRKHSALDGVAMRHGGLHFMQKKKAALDSALQ
jgi:hypothetical protein